MGTNTNAAIELARKIEGTNIDMVIAHANKQSLSIDETREQANIFDNQENVCRAKWYFCGGASRWGDLTLRDIFEMESLGYNYNILEVY